MKRTAAIISGMLLAFVSILSASVSFAANSNLIANPGFEQATGTAPTSWLSGSWGTNTSSFTYDTTGHTGSRSASATVASYASGDAKWYFTPVTVTPGVTYTFSDWYKSGVASNLDAVVTNTSGGTDYYWLGNPAASTAWKQQAVTFTAPANAKQLTIFHSISQNGTLSVDDYDLEAPGTSTPVPPTVNLTAPTNGATVSGTLNVTANASDDKAVSNVQFKLDGANLGTAVTTAPYSTSWNTTGLTNGNHTLTAVATDSDNLSTTSAAVTVNVQNTVVIPPTAPTVSITAPANNATVSGAQTVTANASDTQSVKSVQFKLDGANLGAADTVAPYSASWDTTTATNAGHQLTAVATNAANLTTTSAIVNVTVSNTVTPPPTSGNLIANPSVEAAVSGQPTGWQGDGWGTNTHSFTYENTGQDGTHSLKTTISSYTNGDAKWYFTPVTVTPGGNYNYSEWYKSSADSEIDAMVTMSDGSVQYVYLSTATASPSAWQKISGQFVMPAGAVNATVFHVLSAVGYVQNDSFSFGLYTPAKFNRAIVSLNFDDGWRNIYTNGFPLLKKYGFVSTQYLNSTPVTGGYPDYYTYPMIKDFAAQGSELAWHTRDHTDLTTLSVAQMDTQLTIPAAFLTNIGQPASAFTDFATPYGAYNTKVITEIKKFYKTHRSTDVGYNSKDNFNPYNIVVQNITNTTTPADVQGWVNQAIATNTWLVIVYHEVSTTPETPEYAVTPTNFDQELNGIKQSGVSVQTMKQALAEVTPQL